MPEQARSREELAAALALKPNPKWLFFWGHRPLAYGKMGASCLSQWWEGAHFMDEGIHYLTAEHYMMAEKARVFGDEQTLTRVLNAKTPGEAKKLGRLVSNFEENRWLSVRWSIVVKGNLLKFGQNMELKFFLLTTGNRVLVEASPVDAIWGIGLAADHKDACNPNLWRGLNLLGFALMEVRFRLADVNSGGLLRTI